MTTGPVSGNSPSPARFSSRATFAVSSKSNVSTAALDELGCSFILLARKRLRLVVVVVVVVLCSRSAVHPAVVFPSALMEPRGVCN